MTMNLKQKSSPRITKISLLAESAKVVLADDSKTPRLKSNFWHVSNYRLRVTLALCLAVFVHGLMRANLAIAMVCMVNTTAIDAQRSAVVNRSTACVVDTTEEEKLDYEGTFLWDSQVQALIFSAVFWGGLLTGTFSGWLADRYGAKNLLLASSIIHIFLTWITPLAATYTGAPGLITLRVFMGLGQGLLMPCIASLGSRWFPPSERSTVIAIYTTGNQISTIIGNPLAAFLCQQRHFLGGWPAIFYTYGAFSWLFCVIWIVMITNTPDKNKFVSNDELMYIKQELGGQSLIHRKLATRRVPWRQIFTCVPLYAAMFSNAAASFTVTLNQTYLPTYFKEVLLLDLKSNGLFSALPFVCQWTVKFMFAALSDGLKKRGKVNHTKLAKIFNTIASFWTAMCLIAVGFVDCSHPGLAVALLCLSMSSFGAFACGFLTSLASIAPVFTGIVNSFARVSGQLGAIAAPYVVGLTTKQGTQAEWRMVFLFVAAFLIVSGVTFLLFGSADIQDWATEAQLESSAPSGVALVAAGEQSTASLAGLEPQPDDEQTTVFGNVAYVPSTLELLEAPPPTDGAISPADGDDVDTGLESRDTVHVGGATAGAKSVVDKDDAGDKTADVHSVVRFKL